MPVKATSSIPFISGVGVAVAALIAVCVTLAFTQEPHPVSGGADRAGIDLSGYRLEQVYENDFEHKQKIVFENDLISSKNGPGSVRVSVPAPDAEWIVEGSGGVDIKSGELRASPVPFDSRGLQLLARPRSHLVIWNKHIFPSDFLAAFDMRPNGSTNGLTIVFFAAAAKGGGDIFDLSLAPRQADYKRYHSGDIANYSDAYWSRNTEEESATNRLRKNPGFELVAEGKSRTTGPVDVTHHIRVLKIAGHIEIEINGHVVLAWDDPGKPLGAGRIGLRSMDGVRMITYDNFKVWAVSKR